MGGRVRVDGLDPARACSLRDGFAADFEIRADTASAIPWVEIATARTLSEVLHRLEEWTRASGLPSVRVTLDGRAYVLQAAASTTTDEVECAPSPAPAHPKRMVSREEARRLALALPEAVEQDHHGRPSYRVGGKIFATQWDQDHLNVMLDESGILTAVQDDPETCAEVRWGKRLAAVRVDLRRVDGKTLASLLADAWEGKAPKRLLRG